jgi:phosphohistidine phosphatase
MKNQPEYWYKQSAVIPFRCEGSNIVLLLIKSRKNKKWIFPKGIIEPGLSARDSAKKEALEEAGIEGSILNKKIGTFSYKKWGGKCKVKVYGIEVNMVLDEWEESFRERLWINISDIGKYIKNEKLIELVNKLKLQLEGF